MKVRVSQHKSDGKFFPGETVDYLVAPDDTTEQELADAERQQIKKHKPYRNERAGGAGKPRKKKEPDNSAYESEKPERHIRIVAFLFKLIKWIIKIGIILILAYSVFELLRVLNIL